MKFFTVFCTVRFQLHNAVESLEMLSNLATTKDSDFNVAIKKESNFNHDFSWTITNSKYCRSNLSYFSKILSNYVYLKIGLYFQNIFSQYLFVIVSYSKSETPTKDINSSYCLLSEDGNILYTCVIYAKRKPKGL